MEPMEFTNFAGYWILMPLPEAEAWAKVRPFFDWKIAEEEAVWLYDRGEIAYAEAMGQAPDFWALRDGEDLARVEELLEIPFERRASASDVE